MMVLKICPGVLSMTTALIIKNNVNYALLEGKVFSG